ncbi:putative F-box domain, FBD domain, leucine-rich repeat domain, L domain-containing protein [Rosa chinensis]|uniref:Putative F-box domain, FBD domain, leucine-rich repeat domain, L domain-containing protein n=1 Tax=Rosa chinensis TaxID=74649 RepID=A0A2P6PK38_ROSCH|nr:F-box/FBD/LRR-repeat protein At1g13570 isoform X1 [Rosa chinensis]PRQ22290.1 putative F-box domain, FBD domain, leucine-rich repeat domain, L domain-containing protein [Rosa chinensis]
MEVDRISSLPNGVTEKIWFCLPLRDAVRTSVLSSKWRYKSAMLQDLEFDEFYWGRNQNREFDDDYQIHTTFVNMIDHVLLVHIVPIRKFKLCCTMDEVAPRDIDRWTTHLSRNSIKELIIKLWVDHEYNIPFSLFSCQGLVHLELLDCLLKPPSTFKGFKSLKSLQLHAVDVAQDAFENLVRCSPLLERLTLRHCDGVTNLKIDAPNLQYLHVLGVFNVINLENACSITEAEICMNMHNDQIGVPAGWIPACSSSNLLKIFDRLPHIRRLEIKWRFLEYLSLGSLPEKLNKPCQYLNALSIDICFDDPDAIPTALCLLRSSPALQELEIVMDRRKKLERRHTVVEEVKSSCLDVSYNCTLSQLRLVKITGISGVKAELDFIRFLLLSSPLLERMTITPPRFPEPATVDGFPKLVKELLQFKRESKHAEIILLDP